MVKKTAGRCTCDREEGLKENQEEDSHKRREIPKDKFKD